MSEKPKRAQVLQTVSCDTDRLYGSLPKAAEYLMEIHEKYPHAELEEHWTGYEDMEMRFVWFRPETDEEMRIRAEQERAKAWFEAERRRKAEAREDRRKKYLALKREFG